MQAPLLIVSDPGALQSVSLTVPDQIFVNTGAQAQFTGNFANVQNVNLFVYGPPTVSSDNTNVITVAADGSVRAVGTGSATLTFNYGGKTATKLVTVAAPAAVLKHRYSFNDEGSTTATDSAGGASGTLNGSASQSGGDLVLSQDAYVELPAHLLDGYYALTVEAWADFTDNGGWVRLWDFGSQDANGAGLTSIFFSPHTGSGGMELTTFTPGRNDHVAISTNLDNTANTHIVGVYYPAAGYQELYVNGVLIGSNRGATIPLSDVDDVNNWIGRSQFNADPYINATVHEFRIYEGALNAQQVASDFAAGPDNTSGPGPQLSVTKSENTLTIVWPTNPAGYELQIASAITGPWSPANLTVSTQNGQNVASDTISTTTGAKFYRLIKPGT